MTNPQDRARADLIKHKLRKQGLTLKAFAAVNGFKLRSVSDVVRGVRKCNFGEGRDVAEKLGLLK